MFAASVFKDAITIVGLLGSFIGSLVVATWLVSKRLNDIKNELVKIETNQKAQGREIHEIKVTVKEASEERKALRDRLARAEAHIPPPGNNGHISGHG